MTIREGARNPIARSVQRWLSCVLIFLLCISAAASAKAQTVDDAGLWFAALGSGRFKNQSTESSLRWWFDNHYRLRDDTDGFNQSIVRPGLGYALDDVNTLWAGYAWIRTAPILGNEFDEHRFWQQWTATPSAGNWKFLHRSRYEQRWVETGDDVGLRWRQLARGQRILTSCPQWSFVLWDELFFNLNDTDWGARGGLDQNRAFVGFGHKRHPEQRTRTEIGYLHQFINRQGGQDGSNHILSVNLFY
jgi:hypothetical protein